ncbi:MAG: cytochrome P450 [Myxococcales bacterium]|nr:cytochrome P450 [Myxococcales bacterium]
MIAAPGLRPPSPRGLPLVGNLLDWGRDPFAASTRWAEVHGDIVEMRTPGPGAYLLFAPRLVQELLVQRAADFRKTPLTRGMSCVIGDSVVTLSHEPWSARRRLLNPALRKQALRHHARVMVEHAQAYAARWRSGEPFDLHQEMLDYMFDVLVDVLTTGLGGDDRARLRRGFEVFWDDFSSLEFAVLSLLFDGEPYRRLRTPRRRRQLAQLADFDRIVAGLATHSRAHPGEDLLSALTHSWDAQQTHDERQLREDLTTLVLAAQETTATGLSLTLDLLMRHPGVLTALRAELAPLGDEPLEVEALARLPLLDAVVREGLRLQPPIMGVAREATCSTEIGGYPIAAGTQVVASAWVIQRSHRWWGDDAREFRPQRWLEGRERARFAWFPFGAGPHVCIGMSFALIEMALAIATWVRLLDLVPLGPPPTLSAKLTTRPRDPLLVRASAPTASRPAR